MRRCSLLIRVAAANSCRQSDLRSMSLFPRVHPIPSEEPYDCQSLLRKARAVCAKSRAIPPKIGPCPPLGMIHNSTKRGRIRAKSAAPAKGRLALPILLAAVALLFAVECCYGPARRRRTTRYTAALTISTSPPSPTEGRARGRTGKERERGSARRKWSCGQIRHRAGEASSRGA